MMTQPFLTALRHRSPPPSATGARVEGPGIGDFRRGIVARARKALCSTRETKALSAVSFARLTKRATAILSMPLNRQILPERT